MHFDAPRDRLKESVIHAFIILNESITKLGLSEAWEIGFHVTWVEPSKGKKVWEQPRQQPMLTPEGSKGTAGRCGQRHKGRWPVLSPVLLRFSLTSPLGCVVLGAGSPSCCTGKQTVSEYASGEIARQWGGSGVGSGMSEDKTLVFLHHGCLM